MALAGSFSEDRLPPAALRLCTLHLLDSSDSTEEVKVEASHHHLGDQQTSEWSGLVSLTTRTSQRCDVFVGVLWTRRCFQRIPGNFKGGTFTVEQPHEAMVFQPWHSPIVVYYGFCISLHLGLILRIGLKPVELSPLPGM